MIQKLFLGDNNFLLLSSLLMAIFSMIMKNFTDVWWILFILAIILFFVAVITKIIFYQRQIFIFSVKYELLKIITKSVGVEICNFKELDKLDNYKVKEGETHIVNNLINYENLQSLQKAVFNNRMNKK